MATPNSDVQEEGEILPDLFETTPAEEHQPGLRIKELLPYDESEQDAEDIETLENELKSKMQKLHKELNRVRCQAGNVHKNKINKILITHGNSLMYLLSHKHINCMRTTTRVCVTPYEVFCKRRFSKRLDIIYVEDHDVTAALYVYNLWWTISYSIRDHNNKEIIFNKMNVLNEHGRMHIFDVTEMTGFATVLELLNVTDPRFFEHPAVMLLKFAIDKNIDQNTQQADKKRRL